MSAFVFTVIVGVAAFFAGGIYAAKVDAWFLGIFVKKGSVIVPPVSTTSVK
jgi:hypothetical protein